jgi:hypothetical protein
VIKEAIEYIEHLTQRAYHKALIEPTSEPFDGLLCSYMREVVPGQFGPKLGPIVTPPRAAKLEVKTLTGFLDAIRSGAGGKLDGRIVHVEDYLNVALKSAYSDVFGVRDTVLKATYTPLNIFKFGHYYDDPQEFIIALNGAFLMNEEAVYVQRVASGLAVVQGAVSTADDGFSQTIVVKQGEVRTSEATIKPRVKLIPRRTFDEAAPAESEFLLRLKGTSPTPSIALFYVDGTRWQGELMESIRKHLVKHLPDELKDKVLA